MNPFRLVIRREKGFSVGQLKLSAGQEAKQLSNRRGIAPTP